MYKNEQLQEVARRYFIEKQTQEQISQDMYCSRSTISRMIQKAIDLEVVQIKLDNSIERLPYLEEQFKNTFDIHDIRICRATTEENTKRVLYTLASQTLNEKLHNDMTIGITRGKTMRRMVDNCITHPYKNLSIVQVIGIANNENEHYEGPKIIDLISEKTNAKGYYLFTPHYIENEIARAEFKKLPTTVSTINKLEECEYIVSGINGYEENNPRNIWTRFIKLINKDEVHVDLVGTLLGYGLDINGNIIDSPAYNTLIGKSLPYYNKNSKIMVVANGERKAKVILAALKGGFLDTLVIDEHTAYLVYTLNKFTEGKF